MTEKIVLVNPDALDLYTTFPVRTVKKIEAQIPMGLCCIAAVLELDHHDVSIVDNYVYGLSTPELAQVILKRNPAYVGFYSTSMNFAHGLSCARLLKRDRPQVRIVFGGPHVCAMTQESFKHDCIDYIVKGEGDFLFRDLVRAKGILSCPGILSREDSEEERIAHDVYQRVDDLDSLPLPSRHLLVMDSYSRKEGDLPWPMDTISTSRGCPYHCKFCSTLSRSDYRFRSSENVVDEILFLKNNYNTKSLYFREDNFTGDTDRVVDLCTRMIEKNAILPFQCEIRSNAVTPELIKIMKKAGCQRVWFGAESGSQRVLNMINKGATLNHSIKAVQVCRDADVRVGAAFVIGFPGETRFEMEETFRFACDLGADEAWFQAYVAYPGSEMYTDCLNSGLILKSFNGIGLIETDQFSSHEILEYEERFNRDYLRLKEKPVKTIKKESKVFDIRFKSIHDYHDLLDPILKEQHRRIVLYGASHSAMMVGKALEDMGRNIIGVIDRNPAIHGKFVAGHSVKRPEEVQLMKPDTVLICSSGYQDEIFEQLIHLKEAGIEVLKLYDRYFTKPEDVSIMVTDRCPLRCLHCDCWKKDTKHKELTIKDYSRLFKDIYGTGCRSINITGGELFMRNDWHDILKTAHETGFTDITLNTNGFCLNEEIIKKISLLHIKNIGISVDGDPETHNTIRGHQKAYEKALQAIDLCIGYRMNVTVAMVLNRLNYNKIFFVLQIAETKGFRVVLQPALKTLHYSSDQIENIEIKDDISGIKLEFENIKKDKKLRNLLNNTDEHLDLILDYLKDPTRFLIPCHVGYHRSHIMPDGSVMACLAMGNVGNIQETGFSDLWYSEKYEKIRESMVKGNCPKCMLNCYMSHNLSYMG